MSKISKKRYGLFIIATVLILNLFIFKSEHVKASTITSLKFGSTVSGSITDTNDEQIYSINVPKSGKVELNLKSYIQGGVYLTVENAKGGVIWGNAYWSVGDGDEDNPKDLDDDLYLDSGTYYIHIKKSGNIGKYNLKLNYTSTGNNEKEPNNGRETAQQISLNSQVNGLISETDSDDYYKFNVSKSGKVELDLKSYIQGGVYLTVENAKGDPVWGNAYWSVGDGNEDNPKDVDNDLYLDSGTYYIHVKKGSNTGKYNLKLNYTSTGNNEKEPNNGRETAQQISLNSQVNGLISETDSDDYYKFNVSKSGKVELDLKSYIQGGVYLTVENAKGDPVWGNAYWSVGDGNEDNPKYEDKELYLDSGTYYVHVKKAGSTGKYNLKVNYSSTGSNEIEPNDGKEKAQQISLNSQINGLISETDEDDYYKINVPKPEKVTLNLETYMEFGLYLTVKDLEGHDFWNSYSSIVHEDGDGLGDQPGDVYLNSGIYYIHINKNLNTGKYILNVKCPDLVPAQPVVNEVNNKSTVVSGKTIANGTVTVKIGSKTYTGKANSTGAFNVKIPVQSAGAKVYVSVKNGYGYSSSTKTVTVLDRIAPSVPIVNTITTTSTTITGKTEGNATVIAYVGSRQIGVAKADKNGNYSIKIAAQKVLTKVNVVAVDASNNRSAGRVNTVALIPGQPTVNEVNNKSIAVSGKTIGNGTVTVKIGNKTYTGKSNSAGTFSIKIPVQAAGAKVYVSVKNGYGYSSSTKTVTVLDRIAPSAPVVSKIAASSKTIAGKAEVNAAVIAYVGSKQIGVAKADKNGNYTIKIASQKLGTKINVVAVDGSNNRSAARVSIVQK
ncbi:MAG: Ig-like domain-containing protein [Clostridium sp.]|uniref:Ig-like domain-containing protein n=1 Tax=Clostridium sp. TaxID=1506 RepID=UPI0039E90AEF